MTARTPPKNAPRRCRLLYVEDDATSVELVQQVIGSRRHLVLVVALDMDEALKLARRERPEVMLINIDLAALGALALMQLLRANPATQAAPVLALGGDASPAAAVKGLEAGFFLYLTKPLQRGPLLDALDYALEFAAVERAEQLP